MRNYNLHGLTTVNVELTSRCNKSCWMCGRRKIEREHPELVLKYGDMDFELAKKIAEQLPPNIILQLHNNGEALLYPRFGEAAKLFYRQIRNIVTNGKLLVEKAEETIGNLETIAVSVIENDPEADEQYATLKRFLEIKRDRKPYTIIRANGNVDVSRYQELGLTIATRTIHSPMGSFNYRRSPTIPEIGICLDLLNHLAINTYGEVSICVRFDPKRVGVIGDANTQTLDEIWNSEKRMQWLELHKQGRRDLVALCSFCHFWGVPTGSDYQPQARKVDEKALFQK
jgi:radical SAM protein with 4Fe4S-binding SPASM domain